MTYLPQTDTFVRRDLQSIQPAPRAAALTVEANVVQDVLVPQADAVFAEDRSHRLNVACRPRSEHLVEPLIGLVNVREPVDVRQPFAALSTVPDHHGD